MDDLKTLEKSQKGDWFGEKSDKRTLDDLPRLQASDIPDDGTLPDGSRVRWGAYRHRIRGAQVMQRSMLECPLCKRACRVLFLLDNGYQCRKCANLPYKSEVASRTSRMAAKLPQFGPFFDEVPEAYLEARLTLEPQLRRDLRKDADYHNRRYHARKTA